MNYKYAGLMFLLLTPMNSNAWMSQTVHGIGGLLEVVCGIGGIVDPLLHNLDFTKAQVAGCIFLGVDALLRIASYTSSIGDNAYIQGTLQVTPVVQTAIGLWCVGRQSAMTDKVGGALLAVDGTLRLYENYEAYRQKHQENQQEK